MGKGGDIPPTTKKVREKSCSWATWSFSTVLTMGVLGGSTACSRRCAPYISRASFGDGDYTLGVHFRGSPRYFQGTFSGCAPYILGVSQIFPGYIFRVCPLYFPTRFSGCALFTFRALRTFSGHVFTVYPYVFRGSDIYRAYS